MADRVLSLTPQAQDALLRICMSVQSWQHGRLAISMIATTVLAFVIPVAYRDYRIFVSYGPNGVPNNLFGWIAAGVLLRPFGREMFGTGPYERKIHTGQDKSFLPSGVPLRQGGRPVVGPHVIPQRQLSQTIDKDLKERLMKEFQTFASRNSHLVKMSPSRLEKQTPALFVTDNVSGTSMSKSMDSEISHIHGTSDHSVHMVLSPADCKKVFESEWGQRHALCGCSITRFITKGKVLCLPEEFVFIYAPRNEEEIQIVMQLVTASVKYMTGSDEVR